ncbi:hypothetical protein BJX76DRAFT_325783 [Aspergillus varians]
MPPLLFLLFLLTALLPLTTTASNFPSCIESCITNNPSNSSWCRGGESGRKGRECLCRRLVPRAMIQCMQSCEPDDQWAFGGHLPDACREKLFPEASEASANLTVEEGTAGRMVDRVGDHLVCYYIVVALVAVLAL